MTKKIAMVRGWKNRPKKVRVLRADRDSAIVTGGTNEQALGYHSVDVFEYDVKLFNQIERAVGDDISLTELWKNAKRFGGCCK